MADALNSDEPGLGQVQWHCSEADGGPDVGIVLGLGDKMLWVGEMLDADGVGAMGLVIYNGQFGSPAMPLDYDSIREVIEAHIAPVIKHQATALATAQTEAAELRERNDALALQADEWEGKYAAVSEINAELSAEVERLRKRIGRLEWGLRRIESNQSDILLEDGGGLITTVMTPEQMRNIARTTLAQGTQPHE